MSNLNPMDDRVLAAQQAKTGDLMDLCFDEAWLRSLDDDYEGPVEAGLALNPMLKH